MMQKNPNNAKKQKGQGIVEFALIIPFLMLLFFILIDGAHLVYVQNSVEIAARSAARYGAAVGKNPSGVLYYQDCSGIRAVAKNLAPLASVKDSDVTIEYDGGPQTSVKTACPASSVTLGDRIKVTVTGHYAPLINFFNLSTVPMVSTSYYTIMTDITVE